MIFLSNYDYYIVELYRVYNFFLEDLKDDV